MQELRVAATTLVPWSDVVPDEIQNTELIAQVWSVAGGVDLSPSKLIKLEVWIGLNGDIMENHYYWWV